MAPSSTLPCGARSYEVHSAEPAVSSWGCACEEAQDVDTPQYCPSTGGNGRQQAPSEFVPALRVSNPIAAMVAAQ